MRTFDRTSPPNVLTLPRFALNCRRWFYGKLLIGITVRLCVGSAKAVVALRRCRRLVLICVRLIRLVPIARLSNRVVIFNNLLMVRWLIMCRLGVCVVLVNCCRRVFRLLSTLKLARVRLRLSVTILLTRCVLLSRLLSRCSVPRRPVTIPCLSWVRVTIVRLRVRLMACRNRCWITRRRMLCLIVVIRRWKRKVTMKIGNVPTVSRILAKWPKIRLCRWIGPARGRCLTCPFRNILPTRLSIGLGNRLIRLVRCGSVLKNRTPLWLVGLSVGVTVTVAVFTNPSVTGRVLSRRSIRYD